MRPAQPSPPFPLPGIAGEVDVLVAEDDDTTRDTLAEALALEGFAVATARNGREALEAVVASPPRVLVVDLMMPEMSGWELLERVQADAALARIPVLVMTAVHNPRRPPAVPVFLKPLDLRSLVRAVRAHVTPAPPP